MARLLILLPLLAGASASASDMLSFSVDAFGSLSGSASGGASYNTSYVTASCFSGVGGMRISAGSAAWSTLLAPYLRAGAMACPAVTLPRPSPSLAPALASVVPAYLYASPPGGLTSDVLTQLPDMTTLLILAQALTEKGEKTVCAIDDVLQDWAPSKANTLYALEQSLARTILALNDVIKQVNVLAFGTSVSAPANNYALVRWVARATRARCRWCALIPCLTPPATPRTDTRPPSEPRLRRTGAPRCPRSGGQRTQTSTSSHSRSRRSSSTSSSSPCTRRSARRSRCEVPRTSPPPLLVGFSRSHPRATPTALGAPHCNVARNQAQAAHVPAHHSLVWALCLEPVWQLRRLARRRHCGGTLVHGTWLRSAPRVRLLQPRRRQLLQRVRGIRRDRRKPPRRRCVRLPAAGVSGACECFQLGRLLQAVCVCLALRRGAH